MHYRTLDFIDGIAAVWVRFHERKIAEEAPGEGITGTGGVDNFFQWVGRCAKKGAVRAKKQRSITALLHHYILQTHIQELPHTANDAGTIRILANLFLTHQKDIYTLDDFC